MTTHNAMAVMAARRGTMGYRAAQECALKWRQSLPTGLIMLQDMVVACRGTYQMYVGAGGICSERVWALCFMGSLEGGPVLVQHATNDNLEIPA